MAVVNQTILDDKKEMIQNPNLSHNPNPEKRLTVDKTTSNFKKDLF